MGQDCKRIKRLLAPRRLAPPDLRVCVCVCVPARVCRGLLFMTPDGGGGAYEEQRLGSQLRSVKRL